MSATGHSDEIKSPKPSASTSAHDSLGSGKMTAVPQVQIIAHRGASEHAPENTVVAMQRAWAQRADASEFDVHLTKDKRIVVIHDKDTNRTAGGQSLNVKQSTLEQLRKLDFGSWRSATFRGTRIPTLEEMLAAVAVGKVAFIEVKCGPDIVPELMRVLADSKLKPRQTPIISFNDEVIAAVKKADSKLPAYLLVDLKKKKGRERSAEYLVEKARAVNADGLDLSAVDDINAAFVRTIKAAGLKLYIWTVDEVETARRLAAAGVDGITTNRPGTLRDQLTAIAARAVK